VPFDEDAEIVGALLQRPEELLIVLEAPPLLHHLLRLVLVAPEAGRVDALFYFGELIIDAGALKDTSAVPPRAAAGLRSA
jgi:hypothetical protein